MEASNMHKWLEWFLIIAVLCVINGISQYISNTWFSGLVAGFVGMAFLDGVEAWKKRKE